MRFPDRNSFGETPERFTKNLLKALHQEEKTMKKKSVAIILLAAILTLALAATALAVAMRAGLLEFFQDGDGLFAPDEYAHRLGEDGVLLSTTHGDLEITVTEGAGQLDHYAMVATVALKPGTPGVLEHYRFEPAQPGEGEPIYHIDCSIAYESAVGDVESTRANEDGSFSFLSQLNNIMESADTAQMYCTLSVAKQEAGQPIQDVRTEIVYFPFTIRMEQALDARSLEAPVVIPEATVTLDALYLKQIESGVFANLYFQYDGGAVAHYTSPDELYISLAGEAGSTMLEENSLYIGSWTGGNRYVAHIQLTIGSLPDAVTVRFHDAEQRILGSAEAPLAKQASLPDAPEGYRTTYPAIDYRDVPLPVAYLPNHVFVSAPQGEAIPMRAVPVDPDSTICNLASGMQAEVYAEYGDWALLGFGELFSHESGYVRKTQLVETQAAAQPGVLQARMNAQTEARVAPDPDATILQRLEAGQEVLVLGEMGDWYYVAGDIEATDRALGYVRKQAVEAAGERLTVALKDVAAYASYEAP